MTREKLLMELKRAFGVQRDAVSWAEQNRQPVAIVGRLHFRGAGAGLEVWTGRTRTHARHLAELSEVLADAGALRHVQVLDQS
ncbi:hypothetical protein [Deinococcus soli (ex Cha et al. 2016)]|uniref:hypothetical protein n=1 Tax=Deinococcus soli (ex Cha et al. 2016) TaxID=1309411 RepID=UPI001665A2AC|nr:hypothetical protein [Deinococcus soli (ex Cha et al. 2016)]GGB76637.1 hypothetical protein GCM10008019_36070 [Deinococcus soli (ex Cha et al. 2016)]